MREYFAVKVVVIYSSSLKLVLFQHNTSFNEWWICGHCVAFHFERKEKQSKNNFVYGLQLNGYNTVDKGLITISAKNV